MNKEYNFIFFIVALLVPSCSGPSSNYTEIGNLPDIFPDYKEVTIPVNIAPLNFKLTDKTEKLLVEIAGRKGKLEVKGKDKIEIPVGKWHKLLKENSNDSLIVFVYALQNNKWNRYLPFHIHIRNEPADPWLIYRLIAPGYEAWSDMGIYQRDITSFNEESIIDSRLLPGNCMNCHSFNKQNPREMVFHLRGKIGGTILIRDFDVRKINTKVRETIANCVYPFWHPSGNYIAFSVNSIFQVFHSTKEKRIEVYDSESDVVIYDIDNDKLITSNLVCSKESFETFPIFTPDGGSLFFCSTEARKMPDEYKQVKYNLCRIAFDASNGTFGGKVDTLVNSFKLGKSVSFPRISPRGNYLMFTASSYGNFSIWHKDADLYLMDLETGLYNPIDIVNTEDTESYHSWSSGSNWFVFSSRRLDGLYTRPFIAYIDKDGKAAKPFLLPQKDPDFYDFCLQSFNIPEFVSGKVEFGHQSMIKAIKSPGENLTFEIRD